VLTSNLRLRLGLIAVAAVLVGGTIGYMAIERLSVLDSLYFTLITISTVGFSEPPGGLSIAGRALTIGVLVAGVGSAFFTAAIGFEVMVEEVVGGGRARRRQQRRINKMRDHIVVCGFGRVGSNTWQQLDPTATIVIESNDERAEEARALGVLVVDGDATTDAVLEAASIREAKALIACVQNDSDNVAIVLSARALCPDLLIVARASELDSTRKLELAGADRVVAPQIVGAERLAAMATHPDLAEFIDIAARGNLIEFRVEEIVIDPTSPVCNVPIHSSGLRDESGALILAIKDVSGKVNLSPRAPTVLMAGQTLVLVGTAEQLGKASAYLAGSGD
jgi:voltage-gated potassium channel